MTSLNNFKPKEALSQAKPDKVSAVSAEGALFSNNVISEHLSLSECLRRLGYPEKAIRSSERCGEHTGMIMYGSCDCGGWEHDLTYRCCLRTCEVCAKSRQRRIRRKYLPFLEALKKERGRLELTFLTVSPKNYDNYPTGLRSIKRNFKKFLRSKYVRERINGGFYVIEGKNPNKDWNVHTHAILYGRRLDNRIRGQCSDCSQNLIKFNYTTKTYYCANSKCNSLNVKHRKDSTLVELYKKISGEEVNIHITKQNSSAFTLNYMLKYIGANKDDFASVEDLAIFIATNRKQKLINSFGSFFNHKFVKQPTLCWRCESEIVFIYDREMSDIFYEARRAEPPPTKRCFC